MVDDSLNQLRLSLMQEVLPVSLAMIDRIKKKGIGKAVDDFASSQNPLQELRDEGDNAAKNIREQLDQFKPGLGNPVVSVSVEVDNSSQDEIKDEDILQELLINIEKRLDILRTFLEENSSEVSLDKDKSK